MAQKSDTVQLLLQRGIITPDTLDKARDEATRTGLSFERALERLGIITVEDIAKVRADELGIPYMDVGDYLVDTELIRLVPEHIAQKYKLIPLFKVGASMTVGMIDPQDVVALDQVRMMTRMESIEPVLISEKGLQRLIDTYYGVKGSLNEIAQAIDHDAKGLKVAQSATAEAAQEAPVIKLVNVMISQALREQASDIHIEPEEGGVRIRLRVDGLLHEASILPAKLQATIISRVKVMAKMDIAETRKPQDGRIRLAIENRDVDIRVSTFPTVHGENVVMRLLDKSSILLRLKDLGFSAKNEELFGRAIHRPNGIILVTGPTGSGKTTTLYVALTTISSMEKNIITIEDPVEYELPLIRQTQVNPKAGVTFSEGLRNILRQDPDIIMVGEIRDRETAEIAIQAALTGHLVFSTLHTNDAPSALTRLTDMGIEPFLISSSVSAVLAQRLVRVVCDKCKETYAPPAELAEKLGLPQGARCARGKGCQQCKGSGYKGRTSISELLIIDDEIRRLIEEKQSADKIRDSARAKGMVTLREDGMLKAAQGITTLEEILRVTEQEK